MGPSRLVLLKSLRGKFSSLRSPWTNLAFLIHSEGQCFSNSSHLYLLFLAFPRPDHTITALIYFLSEAAALLKKKKKNDFNFGHKLDYQTVG